MSADVDDATWQETSFAWRVVGSDDWTPLGTAEDTDPRVFHDIRGPRGRHARRVPRGVDGCRGPPLRRIHVRLGGQRGPLVVDAGGAREPRAGAAGGVAVHDVSVPGSFNSEAGCPGDWQPECDEVQMTQRADGIWTHDDLRPRPPATYEYKIATDEEVGRELRRGRRA